MVRTADWAQFLRALAKLKLSMLSPSFWKSLIELTSSLSKIAHRAQKEHYYINITSLDPQNDNSMVLQS